MIRAFFVWPWNENARTKQKQQTNGNRSIWLVCQGTDTNARGFWLVKRMLGWKNVMPEDLSRNQSIFALTSYCNTICQSNNGFSILGISLAWKQRVHVLIIFIHWLIKEITITYRNHFSWSYENRSNKSYYRKYIVPFSGDFQRKTITSPLCHNYRHAWKTQCACVPSLLPARICMCLPQSKLYAIPKQTRFRQRNSKK